MLSYTTIPTPAASGLGCLSARTGEAGTAGSRHQLLPVAAWIGATGAPASGAPFGATRVPVAGAATTAMPAIRVRTAPPVQLDQFDTTLGVSSSRRPLS